MYRIYLVEDDMKILQLTKEKLENYGYDVKTVEDFSKIKEEFLEYNPDLVILDINLPKYDGFFWCRDIRSISKVPIVFLSARDTDMDQVMAVENGGDDYISKPFSLDLFLAKIKGILRRTYGEYSQSENSLEREYSGLILYIDKNIVKKDDVEIELTKNEFILLSILAENLEKIVTRENILTKLWDDMDFVDDNTLSVNINRLRNKLGELNIKDSIITKRGLGYMMKKTW